MDLDQFDIYIHTTTQCLLSLVGFLVVIVVADGFPPPLLRCAAVMMFSQSGKQSCWWGRRRGFWPGGTFPSEIDTDSDRQSRWLIWALVFLSSRSSLIASISTLPLLTTTDPGHFTNSRLIMLPLLLARPTEWYDQYRLSTIYLYK